jgi:hypothetical protein
MGLQAVHEFRRASFLGVNFVNFPDVWNILGSVVFGVSIWVKYLAVLHHLVLHRCRTKKILEH